MQISTEYAYQYKGGRQTTAPREPWDFDGFMRRNEMSDPINNNGDAAIAEKIRAHEELRANMQEIQNNPDLLRKRIAASGLKVFNAPNGVATFI